MMNSQKPRLGMGRPVGVVFLVFLVEFLFVAAPAEGLGRKDKFWEKADVSRVVKAVRRHNGGVSSEPECEHLVRLNFKYLYFNALDIDRFIAMPKPDKVLDRMCKVFSLAADLRSALDQARLLSEADEELSEWRGAAKKIRDCADGIHDTFHDFFKEDTNGSFQATLRGNTSERARFVEYLVTCEEISALLDQELERYFLNPTPDIVRVSTFRSCSIPALSLCLERLSLNVEKSLLE